MLYRIYHSTAMNWNNPSHEGGIPRFEHGTHIFYGGVSGGAWDSKSFQKISVSVRWKSWRVWTQRFFCSLHASLTETGAW